MTCLRRRHPVAEKCAFTLDTWGCVGNRDSYTLGTMCMFDSCMCLGVCASLVVWSLTLLLDDTVSDSLLALVLAWGTGCSPGDKDGYIQQVVQHAEP